MTKWIKVRGIITKASYRNLIFYVLLHMLLFAIGWLKFSGWTGTMAKALIIGLLIILK